MGTYIIRRLFQAAILLFIVSVVTFLLIHAAPGGPSLLSNPELSKAQAEAMARNLGLRDPLPVQYARWLGHLLRGNLGNSYSTSQPVLSLIEERLPNTLLLGAVAVILAVLAAVPLGVVSATRRNSGLDRFITGLSFVGISVPVFWLGIMLVILFAVQWGVLPAGGMYTVGAKFSFVDRIKHLLLPALVLMTAELAALVRYTRSGMISVLSEDYVRTARAKGLQGRQVIFTHALRNALIPVVTLIGVRIPLLVGGAAITETVFSWPGMGRLAVDAATTRDYPVVLGTTITVAAVVVLSSLVIDLLYAYLDPRIRLD